MLGNYCCSQWLILACCSWEYKIIAQQTNQPSEVHVHGGFCWLLPTFDNPTTNELINLPISFSQFSSVMYVYFPIDEPWLSCPDLSDGSSSKINSCCCGSSTCLYWEGKPTIGQTIKSTLSHTWIPSRELSVRETSIVNWNFNECCFTVLEEVWSCQAVLLMCLCTWCLFLKCSFHWK